MTSRYDAAHLERPEPWLQPLDTLVLAYQAVMAGIVVLADLPGGEKWRLLGNHALFSLALVVCLWHLRNSANPVASFLREFYPLIAMLFFYRETGLLVHAFFDWTLDEWLLGVDEELGRVGQSIWNFQQFYPPGRLLNEFFSVAYGFYFVLIPLSALVLYFRAPLSRFRSFMFSLCFTYYLHYLLFILLPAASPRFYMPGLGDSLRGYWVSDWLQRAVEANAYPGGSFPSSHIAAAVLCFAAYPHFRRWRKPVLFLAAAMFMGTIYGRYHYFVDVVAGLGVGLCCYFLGPWLEKKWPLVVTEERVVFSFRRGDPAG